MIFLQLGQQGTWLVLEEAILEITEHRGACAYAGKEGGQGGDHRDRGELPCREAALAACIASETKHLSPADSCLRNPASEQGRGLRPSSSKPSTLPLLPAAVTETRLRSKDEAYALFRSMAQADIGQAREEEGRVGLVMTASGDDDESAPVALPAAAARTAVRGGA